MFEINRCFQGILAIALFVPAPELWAEESGANPLKHPDLKVNQKVIRDDLEKIRISNQKEELAKKEVALNKNKYERTQKSYGADDPLTIEAKERYDKAQKIYIDVLREHVSAQKGLTQNQAELQHSKQELLADSVKQNENTEK